MPHLTQMNWDYKDQLLGATNGTFESYYVYDASGNRVRKVVEKGNVKEVRFYVGDYEVYRKTTSGTLDVERTTVHISDDQKRIAMIDNDGTTETIRYQIDNHLGSASLELDQNADIISYEEYHPFGTTSYRSGRTETEVSLKRYKYVGKERDEETGLYYYGARYYASWIARFVSVDPLQHEYPIYTPYQYAGNKPIIAIDLDGLESKNVVQEEETGQQIQPPQVLQDNLTEQKPHVPELDAIWFKNEDGSFTLIDPHKNRGEINQVRTIKEKVIDILREGDRIVNSWKGNETMRGGHRFTSENALQVNGSGTTSENPQDVSSTNVDELPIGAYTKPFSMKGITLPFPNMLKNIKDISEADNPKSSSMVELDITIEKTSIETKNNEVEKDSVIARYTIEFDEKGNNTYQKWKVHKFTNKGRPISKPYKLK